MTRTVMFHVVALVSFIKSAVCDHLAAYLNLNDLNLFGKQYAKPAELIIEKFIS